MSLLANFNFIHLDAVNVTCPGAIAPTRLFLNLFIIVFAIELVESDLEYFWLTTVSTVRSNIWNVLSTKNYFRDYWIVASIVASFTLVLGLMPGPMKDLQYMLSLVTVSLFIHDHGVSSHSSSCNAAIGIVPADTILAYATSLVFYLMILPLTYLLSQVIAWLSVVI